MQTNWCQLIFNYKRESESSTDVMINSPLGPGDEMIVPGDIEGSSNMVSSSWSVEGKAYRSHYDT